MEVLSVDSALTPGGSAVYARFFGNGYTTDFKEIAAAAIRSFVTFLRSLHGSVIKNADE
jgi:hypothetical protein